MNFSNDECRQNRDRCQVSFEDHVRHTRNIRSLPGRPYSGCTLPAHCEFVSLDDANWVCSHNPRGSLAVWFFKPLSIETQPTCRIALMNEKTCRLRNRPCICVATVLLQTPIPRLVWAVNSRFDGVLIDFDDGSDRGTVEAPDITLSSVVLPPGKCKAAGSISSPQSRSRTRCRAWRLRSDF